MKPPRVQQRWLLAACGVLALAGCGDSHDEPPAAPAKKAPQLPYLYQGQVLEYWKGIAPDAPVPERIAMAYALAQLERTPTQSVPLLRRLLQDENAGVRLAALEATGRLAPQDPSLAAQVVQAFAEEADALRARARSAAQRLGPVGLPALRTALHSENPQVQWNALAAMDGMQADALPALAEVGGLVRDPAAHGSVRRQAVFTLARLGPLGVRALVAEMGDGLGPELEETATDALARAAPASLGPLYDALGLEAPQLPLLRVLVRLGPTAAPGVPALLQMVQDGSPNSREAVDALIAIGAPSLPGLRALLDHERGAVRAAARRALEALGEE